MTKSLFNYFVMMVFEHLLSVFYSLCNLAGLMSKLIQ